MKRKIQGFATKLKEKFTKKIKKEALIQELINDKDFMGKLLAYSGNDIDVLCTYLGDIMVYYALSNDTNLDYSLEELLNKRGEVDLYSIDEIKEKGFFTHSCNGGMIEQIKNNGLGSPLNTNEKLYSALTRLEQRLNTTGQYTKQQSGKSDEVYFTSAGATSFGYACNFVPERLFLGILRQGQDQNIPVEVGENKKDYYRKVIYQKFGDNINTDIMADIETVLNGYFSDSNYIVSFKADEVISTDNIYMEVVGENNKINLGQHIEDNCRYGNFFTTRVGSNSNTNNMDNLVMINTIIPPEKLRFLKVPDRYDLIQLIALCKGLQQGEKIDYFSFDRVENKEKNISQSPNTSMTQKLGRESASEMSDTLYADETDIILKQQEEILFDKKEVKEI